MERMATKFMNLNIQFALLEKSKLKCIGNNIILTLNEVANNSNTLTCREF